MALPPLDGIRVADFTWVWAGPYCTMNLAFLGADVIRVESNVRPCLIRQMIPFAEDRPGLNRSGYFNQYSQAKSSVTINLSMPKGREVARQLALASDVVANNFAAGVMDRLGLGYEELRKGKPEIIMVTMTAFGEVGPLREYVAYGPAQVPLCGLSALTGYRDGPPGHTGFSYSDPNAGIHGALAVMAALYHRNRTGDGQHIDLGQWEASVALVAEGFMEYAMNQVEPPRIGNRDPLMAPHGVFRCRDEVIDGRETDTWVAIGAADDAQWRGLAGAIGRPELGTDPRFSSLEARQRNEDELERMVDAWTSQQQAQAAVRILQTAGVAASVVACNKDLFEDPHLRERGYFVELNHPEVGVRRHTGIPWRMSRTPCAVTRPAPQIGADTERVMRQVLGYSDSEIAQLQEAGVLK